MKQEKKTIIHIIYLGQNKERKILRNEWEKKKNDLKKSAISDVRVHWSTAEIDDASLAARTSHSHNVIIIHRRYNTFIIH